MILFVSILYQKLLLICAYPCCYCKWELLILPPPIPNALYQRIRFHLVDMEGCQRFLWASSRLFQSDLLVCVSSSYSITAVAKTILLPPPYNIAHSLFMVMCCDSLAHTILSHIQNPAFYLHILSLLLLHIPLYALQNSQLMSADIGF